MTGGRFPARLHVLLARDSAHALVIRRGPTRCVATVGWDRATDRFSLGQWLHGRIYERRCDLSPNGRHLVYFAMNGHWDGPARGAWTAISRAPWLKALTLLPKGDCWHGGGLFGSNEELWVNNGYGHTVLRDDAPLARTGRYPGRDSYGGECPGVYYVRLQRDGWTLQSRGPDGAGGTLAVFERAIDEHWTLRKLAHEAVHREPGKGCYFDEHQLLKADSGDHVDCPDWEWADVDGRRIVWAQGGKLFAARMQDAGLGSADMLFDFNGLEFERIEAPY